MKEKIVHDIIELEWEMFSRVNSYGGRARCQEDRETFNIMRSSQASAWPEELLQSYYNDLVQAKKQNRNLMTEKYARMMEFTFPEEYKMFADSLPVIDSKILEQIERITTIHLQWKHELFIKYPKLSGRGRVLYTKEDSRMATSFETYLRGELRTYSPNTVRLYYNMSLGYKNKGENLEETYLLNVVKKYGYDSLDEAEKRVDSPV